MLQRIYMHSRLILNGFILEIKHRLDKTIMNYGVHVYYPKTIYRLLEQDRFVLA